MGDLNPFPRPAAPPIVQAPPPPPPRQAATPAQSPEASAARARDRDRRRASRGATSTILTGPRGVTTAAPTAGKTLLGQ